MVKRLTSPRRLEGEITPPGDKSIAHRAALFNALARGKARVDNFSPGEDCLSTVSCLRGLGVKITFHPDPPPSIEVEGAGERGLQEPEQVLDCGNSGTTLRLLCGVLAAQPFLSLLTGDASLRSRPMDRVIHPLRQMGAQIWGRGGDHLAPLAIRGGGLRGIQYRLPVASAQVKSALLLAGLGAQGDTRLEEPSPSRDHTERMLRAMGARLEQKGGWLVLSPLSSPLAPLNLTIPGDISAATFFLVAGVIHPQARVRVRGVGMNPTRSGAVEVLREMGAKIEVEGVGEQGGEPVAHLTVSSSSLRGVEISGGLIPRLIDEIPVLAVAACAAHGTTIIRDAGELRVKESDRIATTVKELGRLGAQIEGLPDGMVIRGRGELVGASVESYGDHRLSMALAVAALIARGETVLQGAEVAAVSYPAFYEDLEKLSH